MTSGVLVGSDNGRVEHHPFKVRLLQSLENRRPATLLRPAIKSLIDRIVLAEAFGQISPRRAGPGNPQHGIEKTTVIGGVPTGRARTPGKQRLDPGKLLVGQFVEAEHRSKSRSEWIGRRTSEDEHRKTNPKSPINTGLGEKMLP